MAIRDSQILHSAHGFVVDKKSDFLISGPRPKSWMLMTTRNGYVETTTLREFKLDLMTFINFTMNIKAFTSDTEKIIETILGKFSPEGET